MKTRLLVLGIAVAVMALYIVIIVTDEQDIPGAAFHVTLADPSLYSDGVYTESARLEAGTYEVRFVPNGDSPQNLSISIIGDSVEFDESYLLKSTPQGSESARYYTWDYLGKDEIAVLETQDVEIIIDPGGEVMGPVSVSLVKREP